MSSIKSILRVISLQECTGVWGWVYAGQRVGVEPVSTRGKSAFTKQDGSDRLLTYHVFNMGRRR